MTDLAKTKSGVGPSGLAVSADSAVISDPSSAAPAVEVKGLTRTFSGSRPGDQGMVRQALAGLDLAVPSGQFVAIIGASGCGKSTLLRLLGGLDEPTSGRISIDGEDPRVVKGRGVIGLVPQSPALLPWKSVADNVSLLGQLGPAKATKLAATDHTVDLWLERVELGEERNLLPHQLSGGMQQRVALARAFAIEPTLLLMDEPFNALDEITRHHMQTLLIDLWRLTQPTVVFVTHSIDEAVKLADRVVVMATGRAVADIPIELDRPRDSGIEDTPQFRDHAALVRRTLIDVSESEGRS